MSTSTPATTDTVTTAIKPPRKFPPLCWTQDETLALIEAYRERWYALRRGYLRTADWDAVAAAVTSRYPDVTPPKTSAQCRHKMEKLRQRYRAEKQRALSYPYPAGKFFSNWFFFENMDAMENGTEVSNTTMSGGDGSGLKMLLDQNLLKLKVGFGNGVKSKRFDSVYRDEEDEEEEDLIDLGKRKVSKLNNVSGGFNQQPVMTMMLPPGSSSRGKKVDNVVAPPPHFNEEFWVNVSNNNNNRNNNNNNSNHYSNYNNSVAPLGYRAKYNANLNAKAEPRATMNEGVKKGRSGVEEIVESIKLMGEGFVRMERAKMDMAREMEEMRMEMEMKRNEMLLQSQKQIVDAFVNGLVEMRMNKKRNKKAKTDLVVVAAAESAENN